ncbi:MAG: biopolymer transporter ExbD [Candidatus Riflebacteria bacterium]|nr:biopolymer transporter ExbD [Candidatus Riflebacteria bacterium]
MKKLLPEKHKQKPQIVVTNLIDVILLLVFFFMITSSFARNQEKLPIDVPKAANATTMETENMTVQIAKNGHIFVAGKSIEMAELTSQIKTWVTNSPDRPIMVEADKDANYGRIIHVLDQIRSFGAVNIGLATRPESK